MKFLLRLKHWQLFGLVWGLPILMNVYAVIFNPFIIILSFPLMIVLFMFGTYGWVWAIVVNLQSQVPDSASVNLVWFKLLIFIPIAYIISILITVPILVIGDSETPGFLSHPMATAILMIIHLGSMIIIFWCMNAAAKTIKSAELGRVAKFDEYFGELIMILFSIIGFWTLQPRLNKLIERNKAN